MFRLGWFGNITSPVWNGPFSVNDARTWTDGRYFARLRAGHGTEHLGIVTTLSTTFYHPGTWRDWSRRWTT